MKLSSSSAFHALLASQLPMRAVAKTYESRFDGVSWDDDNWRITTSNLDQGHYQSRQSLANGYLGINVASVGPFFEVDTQVDGDNINGWPLFDRRQTFATIAGFYDSQPSTNGSNFPWLYQYGGESVISGVPHWSGLHVINNGKVLNASVDPSEISGFESTFDYQAGVMSWRYTWTASGEGPIDIEYVMYVHKLHVNQAAVQLKLTAWRDVNVTVLDVLNGDAAVRSTAVTKGHDAKSHAIWSSIHPNGVSHVTGYIYSTLVGDECADRSSWKIEDDGSLIGHNKSSIGQSIELNLEAGQTSSVHKYIGGASTDAFGDPKQTAKQASSSGASLGFEDLLHSHMKEWADIMPEDSVDSYRHPVTGVLPSSQDVQDLQITSVVNAFYLLQNTVGPNAVSSAGNNTNLIVNSIPVCGLGSECYGGLIFWDVEVWMQPGLAVAFPESAKQIALYRVAKFEQAKRNVETAFTSSQNHTSDFSGAIFPWTSGRYGNCTGTGPCWDYEYHINGDIALELLNYLDVSGDVEFFKTRLFPIIDAVATTYSEVLAYNSSVDRYQLLNATDPVSHHSSYWVIQG
jgi:trehalose/maltose hydrolase-like predicted phosphorylase